MLALGIVSIVLGLIQDNLALFVIGILILCLR